MLLPRLWGRACPGLDPGAGIAGEGHFAATRPPAHSHLLLEGELCTAARTGRVFCAPVHPAIITQEKTVILVTEAGEG